MKRFVQYFEEDEKGNYIDMIGSDGIFQLDARNSVATNAMDAVRRWKKIKRCYPRIKAYQIQTGSLFNPTSLTKIIRLCK